jgi:hypothetical protein
VITHEAVRCEQCCRIRKGEAYCMSILTFAGSPKAKRRGKDVPARASPSDETIPRSLGRAMIEILLVEADPADVYLIQRAVSDCCPQSWVWPSPTVEKLRRSCAA